MPNRLKVRAGEALSASKHNRIVDALPQRSQGGPAAASILSAVRFEGVNTTGGIASMGHLMAFKDSQSTPAIGDPVEVGDELLPEMVAVSWHDTISRIAVAAEPIPADEAGQFILFGQCVIQSYAGNDPIGSKPFAMIDPVRPWLFKPADAGIARVLYQIDDTTAVASFRDGNDHWMYELTEDAKFPDPTSAILLNYDKSTWDTTEISLSDPLGLMDDQLDGNIGWCRHAGYGNEFHALQAVC